MLIRIDVTSANDHSIIMGWPVVMPLLTLVCDDQLYHVSSCILCQVACCSKESIVEKIERRYEYMAGVATNEEQILNISMDTNICMRYVRENGITLNQQHNKSNTYARNIALSNKKHSLRNSSLDMSFDDCCLTRRRQCTAA